MTTYSNHPFLLSDRRRYRVQRHLVFWTFWGLWFTMVRFLNPKMLKETGQLPNFWQTLGEGFFFLLPHTVMVYPLLYFILPRYVFKGKYFQAALWVLVFLLLTISVSAALLVAIPWHKVAWLSSQRPLFQGVTTPVKWMLAYLSATQGALTGAALAASFKMFKFYYLKTVRNAQLQKEKTEAQMQLLTAQIHPHFLFNTLNNIYSQTQLESPRGSAMIMGLSDMLRYVLYEGQKPLVPLRQELMMIGEYVALERIRYGNRLEVHLQLPEDTGSLYIAPLLLLPFVENCFKHGTSKVLDRPWISLIVELKGHTLEMKLINGKVSAQGEPKNEPGIGINNVRQRLELLYEGRYDLQIREDEEVFVVDLRLELIQGASLSSGRLESKIEAGHVYENQ